jgi:hypothetical protein
MCAAQVGALLVMLAEDVIGMFSERDLMKSCRLGEARSLACSRRRRHDSAGGVRETRCVSRRGLGDLVRWTLRERKHAVEELTEYVTGKYPE